MKTTTQSLETRTGSVIERWKKVMVACALSLIVACGSPVGPQEVGESVGPGGEGESDTLTPVILQELGDDEWLPGGSGDGEDRRQRRW